MPVNRQNSESWALITPSDLLRSVRHRLPSILMVTLLTAATIVAFLLAWPNNYRSDGMMYVRLGRGAIGVDPTANPNTVVSLQESRTTEVMSVGNMIGSREIAERTVQRIGADTLLQPRTWIDRAMEQVQATIGKKTQSWGELTADEVEAQIRREDAIKKVQNALSIDVPRNGYTIGVSAKSADPMLAQAIAQTVMDEYGQYHVEAHRAAGSLQFFEKQNEASRKKASAAQVTLQAAKNELGWMSPENAEKALLDRITSLEITLDATEGQLADAQSRAAELGQRLASTEQWVPSEITSGAANEAHDEMRGQLYTLEVEQSDSMAKIGPKHPRYRMMQEKLNSSKAIINKQVDVRELRVEAVNPVHQDLETAHTAALAELAGLKSQREALRGGLVDARADVNRLNSDAAKLAELHWSAKIAERDYLEYSQRYAEARITDELDTENLSDVSIIQDASLNLKKASPQRAMLALLGAMLGFSLGLLQAVLRPGPAPRSQANRVDAEVRDFDGHVGRERVGSSEGRELVTSNSSLATESSPLTGTRPR